MEEHSAQCPVCALQFLTVTEYPGNYVISWNGKPIDKCPDCGTKLEWLNGELVESEEEDNG